MLTSVINAAHWFNPIAHLMFSHISKDCELRCDAGVMKTLGSDSRNTYMETVIDVASMVSQNRISMKNTAATGMFMASDSSKKTLERRFKNLKNSKNRKGCKILLLLLLCAVAFLNVTVMSVFGVTGSRSETTGNIAIDDAIRAYYRLSGDEAITKKMLEGITSIDIAAAPYSGNREGYVLTEVYINRNMMYSGILERYVADERFNNMINHVTDDRTVQYLKAFYTLKDPFDPRLENRAQEEMYTTFPDTKFGALYVLDPKMSEREYTALVKMFDERGFFRDKYIKDGIVYCDSFSTMRNLKEITVSGIKLNSVPAGIRVTKADQ